TPARLAELMVGTRDLPQPRAGKDAPVDEEAPPRLAIRALVVEDDGGRRAVDGISLEVRPREIVGVAGVSGNGQRELVEALVGQRRPAAGDIAVDGERYRATRGEIRRHRVFSLPEEPLRNGCVASMSVAENVALRTFDRPPVAAGAWLRRSAMREQARRL